jgi:hypothetical protein
MPARAVAHHEASQLAYLRLLTLYPDSLILFSACIFTPNCAILVPYILASVIVVTFAGHFCSVEVLSCSSVNSHYSTSMNLLQRRI